MAKLHWRVPRFPYLDLTLALAVALGAAPVAAQDAPPDVAEAGDPDLRRLEALSARLASEDPAERRAAYEGMTALEPEMIPAVRARIESLSRHRPPPEWVDDFLHRFHRRGSGDEGEPDDVALGALAELGQDHPRAHEHEYALALAEPLFLWRGLQTIGTDEAHRAAYPLIALDGGKWMFEGRNWVRRAGPRVMAAALRARSHEDRRVRSWSRWAIRHLGADDPGRAVHELEDDQLADVLLAYAHLRMQSAMRVIVSYVDSERRRVRRAAREAMARYGGNAIWVLRTAYRNQTGELPPREWGWQRITTELYARADEQRLAAVRAALDEAAAARAAGDLATMAARFDEVLARAPELEEPNPVAEGYAARAAAELEAGHHDVAIGALRRALRLAPEHERAAAWRAQLAFAEAEALRADGLLDLDAYERVSALSPDHAGAAAVLAAARPEELGSPGRDRSAWALAAAALLALLGLALTFQRGRPPALEGDPAHASTLDAPTFDDTAAEVLAREATANASTTDPGGAFEVPRFDAAFDAADATWADSTLPG